MTIKLSIFGLVASMLVAFVYVATKPLILAAKEDARREALYELAEPLLSSSQIGKSVEKKLDSSRPSSLSASIVLTPIFSQDSQVGTILPLTTDQGYSGRINMLLALDMSQRIVGFRVIDHKETPGLGDKIDIRHSNWILGFNKLAYRDFKKEAWAVTKDGGKFDTFTGATITPRAVVESLAATLAYLETQPDILKVSQ